MTLATNKSHVIIHTYLLMTFANTLCVSTCNNTYILVNDFIY